MLFRTEHVNISRLLDDRQMELLAKLQQLFLRKRLAKLNDDFVHGVTG